MKEFLEEINNLLKSASSTMCSLDLENAKKKIKEKIEELSCQVEKS